MFLYYVMILVADKSDLNGFKEVHMATFDEAIIFHPNL